MPPKPTLPTRKTRPRRNVQSANEPSQKQNEAASETAKEASKEPLQGKRHMKHLIEESKMIPKKSKQSKTDENAVVEENITTAPNTSKQVSPVPNKVQKSRSMAPNATTSTRTRTASAKRTKIATSQAVTSKKKAQAKKSTLGEPGSSTESKKITTSTKKCILQLKITLRDVSPPIWRRIQVISTDTFHDLYTYINEAMGWLSNHCHQFTAFNKKTNQEIVLTNAVLFALTAGKPKEENTKIQKYLNSVGDTVMYMYDMGDSWMHSVVVEKILPFSGRREDFPKCTGGRRTSPPEDCGGSDGYMNLVQVFNDPCHPEYKELIEGWLNELYPGWEPDNFKKSMVFRKVRMWVLM